MKFQIFQNKHPGFGKMSLAAIMFGLCLIGCSDLNAQTKRRAKKGVPQPVATPVSSSTLIIPEIVRRADENETDTALLTTGETQTTELPNDVDTLKNKIDELNAKIRTLETENKPAADAKEKRLLMSLDILSRAEQRSETLRKQLYEIIEKENTVKARVEQLTFEMRPEMIDRNAAFTGSLRPEDVRDARRKSLESEKRNLESLLVQLQANREKLEQTVQRADYLVEKIRLKFEKEIDDSLTEEEKP